MRENIIILSHNFHSFLINEIEFASKKFKQVYYIGLYNKQLVEKFESYENVKLYLFKKSDLYFNSILNIKAFFKKEFWKEIKDANRKKVISKVYIKSIFMFLGIDKILNKITKKIEVHKNPKNWVYLSAWYYGTAFAIARQKEKMSDIYAISLVHAFEVDKSRNKNTEVLFRKWYHNKLDLISFISNNVLENFKNGIGKSLNLKCDKVEVFYLGTKKIFPDYVKLNKRSNIINVLSCSNVVKIKRIPLIFEALYNIKNYKVEWYHIGEGKSFKEITSEILIRNDNKIKINFLGYMNNIEVHKFILEHNLDLFINLSSTEGIPVSIMEALAYGLPVVATDVGGNSEIVNNKCGRLVHAKPTIKEIDDAIIELKELESKKKIEMSDYAKEQFNTKFNADNIRNQFYERLTNLEGKL